MAGMDQRNTNVPTYQPNANVPTYQPNTNVPTYQRTYLPTYMPKEWAYMPKEWAYMPKEWAYHTIIYMGPGPCMVWCGRPTL